MCILERGRGKRENKQLASLQKVSVGLIAAKAKHFNKSMKGQKSSLHERLEFHSRFLATYAFVHLCKGQQVAAHASQTAPDNKCVGEEGFLLLEQDVPRHGGLDVM